MINNQESNLDTNKLSVVTLYKNKRYFPIVTLILFITCLIITIPTSINTKYYDSFALFKDNKYFFQFLTFQFEHSIYIPYWIFVHLTLNLSMLFVLGLLIERTFGNKIMLIITVVSAVFSAFGGYILVNFIGVPDFEGNPSGISGASGIFYGYAPLVIYVLFQMFKKDGGKLFRTKFLYIVLVELFLMLIITPLLALDAPATNLIHLASFIGGTIVVLFYVLNKQRKEIILNDIFTFYDKKVNFNKLYLLLTILPVFVTILYFIV